MTMDFKIALAGARLRRQAANLRVGIGPGPRATAGGRTIAFTGEAPKRVAMIEGDSLEQAQAFFGSAAFRNLAQRGKVKIPTGVRALAAKDLETMRHSRETASPRPNFANANRARANSRGSSTGNYADPLQTDRRTPGSA